MKGLICREDYRHYANKLTSLLYKAKKLYYLKLFLHSSNNSTKTWSYINRLIGNSSKGTLEKLKVNDSTLSGLEMLNYANGYFVGIANTLTENFSNSDDFVFLL